MTMKIGNKLDALVKMLNLLDMRRTVTATSMAATLGVGERTVYRYLRSLQLAGYPIYFDNEHRSYRFADGYQLKRPEFGLQLSDLLDLKRCVIHTSSVGITVLDRDGRCILANGAFGALNGVSQEEVLNNDVRISEIWQRSGLWAMAEECLADNTERHREFRLTCANGGEMWLSCTMTPFESRGACYLLLVAYDITALKRTETHLAVNDSVAMNILEAMPVGITWSNRTGCVEHLNDYFTERYGWTREDVPTFRDWLRVAYPDPIYRADIKERWKVLRSKAEESGTMTVLMETTIACKDGSCRNVTISTRLMPQQALAVFTETAA